MLENVPYRKLDSLARAIEFPGRDAQRRHEHNGIENRSGKQAVPAGSHANPGACVQKGIEPLAIRASKLDAGDKSALPDVPDMRVRAESVEVAGEALDLGLQLAEDVFVLEYPQAGEGGGAGQLVPAIAMAVIKGLS